MNVRQKKSWIAVMAVVASLSVPMAANAGLLSNLLGAITGKKATTTSTTAKTTTATATATATSTPKTTSLLGGTSSTSNTTNSAVKAGLLSQLTGAILGTNGTTVNTGIGLDTLLSGVLNPVLNLLDAGIVLNLVDNVADLVLFQLDVGGITGSYISIAGNLINVADPILKPVLEAVVKSGRTVTHLLMPTVNEVGGIVGLPVGTVVNEITPSILRKIIAAKNSVTGGEIKALIPMPLDPNRTCESCHQSKASLLLAMTDVVYNTKYPGLILDALFIDNFYVSPEYTSLPDSMMTAASKHAKWEGCITCHGSGATFNPFPSDNWVPRSNPNDGPEVAKGFGSTNDAKNSCGKCHAWNAEMFNKGLMGTHRGHLWGFNYNDVEAEAVNTESNFFYDPLGSYQAGTDLSRLPLDRNCKRVNAGYFQSRASCSTCHQSCSDCHMTGPGNSPTSTLAVLDLPKIDPLVASIDIVNVDKTHMTPMVRVKAMEASALRRGGVTMMEMRKGYVAGISRGIPYSVYETGMDVKTHKIHKPTTLEQGNTLAPQTQQQSIDFCWRCHFRTGAEFLGNWINVVPNINYAKSTLGHLQAGMTCTDCHKRSQVHGETSATSQSFQGTSDAVDNPSHPGGNPVGSTPAWDITPNPTKVTCGLCHTSEGKKLGSTAGLNYGDIVTPRYQQIAKMVKGFNTMPVPGNPAPAMSHKNVKCEACHTQAMQNCWNCHLEKSESITGLPLIGTNSLSLDLLFTIVNVREAEGIPALSKEENALLQEVPAQNDAASLALALTFPTSPNTVNKSVRFLARNNKGQVGSVVHCPGGPAGINNPERNPQPTNTDGGHTITKSGISGEIGAVGDPTYAAEGSWYMEPGHSIARNPDGIGYEACYNCHADTVRLGQDPITYYRKNPWVMKSIGAPEALMPGSHYADKRYINPNGGFNCSCHSKDALVHNGNETTGPWQLDVLPEVGTTPPPTGPDGVALYTQKCASCHEPLATSSKQGSTFDDIKNALTLPYMSFISLTDAQIHAIAKALGGE